MKHLVDQSTGVLVLIPESEPDKRILYHLMNCIDLSNFTKYLELNMAQIAEDITTDLGVSASECVAYTSEPVQRLTEKTIHGSLEITERAISPGRLIGFNRESYSNGGF